MGYRDEDCESKNRTIFNDKAINSKTKQVKQLIIEDAGGGGGGGTFVFCLNSVKVAVPLIIAGGGGGLGIGRYLDDDSQQHGRGQEDDRFDISGEMHGEINRTGGPGGGWKGNPDQSVTSHSGVSLLEGGRGKYYLKMMKNKFN